MVSSRLTTAANPWHDAVYHWGYASLGAAPSPFTMAGPTPSPPDMVRLAPNRASSRGLLAVASGFADCPRSNNRLPPAIFLRLSPSCNREGGHHGLLKRVAETSTPQSEPLEGMVPNSAGGHAYPVDDMTRLRRFLILGSEGGSYYADERKLTLENAAAVKRCIENDGTNAVYEIAYISRHGRAPKVGPPLFALAMAATYGHPGTRELAFGYLPQMARTGSQLQMFIDYIGTMRGWGRGLRRAVGKWYTEKDIKHAVYQTVKYRQRYNWTHRDLLRKAHPKAVDAMGDLFAWITQDASLPDDPNFALIHAYEQAKTADPTALARLIRAHDLTWEMMPSEQLDKPEVWEALAERMPLTALIRNLATLTRGDVIAPMKSAWVCERLNAIGNARTEDFTRIHPIAVLSALLTYRAGKGARGHHTWTPVPQVVDALDQAFDQSFDTAPQTNQRFYLGIDVSGSMASGAVAGVPGLTPRMAAAAMTMAIARREPNYYIAGFAARDGSRFSSMRRGDIMAPLSITASDSLNDAMHKTQSLDFGATDCALPMLDALEKKISVDVFVIFTDSETWAGPVHPAEALRKYRQEMGIPAKLVVVAMVSNGFTIADPEDAGMMDVVGFDSAAPALIADFAKALDTETLAGIERDVQDSNAGRVLPWGEVEKDVVEPEDVPAENVGYTDDF